MNTSAKKMVLKAGIFAGLGGLLFGLDQGFINGSLSFIQEEMNLTLTQSESFASIMLIGCIVGVLFSGPISRSVGRRNTLCMAALFFAVFTLSGALTHNLTYLFFSRFALGLAVGCASFVVPLYLSEIAPKNVRGGFIAMYQFMITVGICVIYFSNSLIGKYLGSWRLMLGVIALPAVVMLFGVIAIPKSPRWLVLKGKGDKAREVLLKTRETKEEVDAELDEINESMKNVTKQTGWTMLKEKYFIKVLALGIVLMFLQQFSGINSVIYYSGEIFKKAGFDDPSTATVIMGFLNVFVTIIAIKYVDKWGRKPILYFGLIVMTITLIIIGSLFKMQESGTILNNAEKITMLVSCLVYVASFAVSLGPIIWIICAEIYPLEGRDFGLTVSTVTIWFGCFLVVQFTLTIIHNFGGSWLFFIFAVCCVIGFAVIYFFTPETKGVSLEEIEMNLKNGKPLREIGFQKGK